MADIIVSQQHKEAVETHQRIITSANLAQQNLWDMCQGLKKMRDDKLYKELGYQNFEDYCETEIGMKRRNAYNYISIVEKINPENVQTFAHFGKSKLMLLATISEPEQAEIAEKLDLENTTVKQLKAEIEKLKDDNLNLSMNYDRMDANRIKLGNENTELKIENKTLQKQVEELENRPVEVAVDETELQRRLSETIRALNKDAEQKNIELENFYRESDKSLHRTIAEQKEEIERLKAGTETGKDEELVKSCITSLVEMTIILSKFNKTQALASKIRDLIAEEDIF